LGPWPALALDGLGGPQTEKIFTKLTIVSLKRLRTADICTQHVSTTAHTHMQGCTATYYNHHLKN